MSPREEGIVVSSADSKFLIASRNGICLANRNGAIRVGDTVCFSRNNQEEPSYAYDITQSHSPLLQFKIMDDNCVLLKMSILRISDTTFSGRRLFETDFLKIVRESQELSNRTANSFIGKTVFVKCCHGKKNYFWEIQDVLPSINPKTDIVGLAYQENTFKASARVYAPGYPEDFLLRKSSNFKPYSVIGKWVRFTINGDTAEPHPTLPITVEDKSKFETQKGPLIKMACSRVNGKILTAYDDIVNDPHGQIEKSGNFQNMELTLEMNGNLQNKVNFIVHGGKKKAQLQEQSNRNLSRRTNQPQFTTHTSSNRNNQKKNAPLQVPSALRPPQSREPVQRTGGAHEDEPSHYNYSSDGSSTPPSHSPPERPQRGNQSYEPTSRDSNQYANQNESYRNNMYHHHAPRSFPPPTPALSSAEYRRIIEQKEEELQCYRRRDQEFGQAIRQSWSHQEFREFVFNFEPHLFRFLERFSASH